MAYVSNTLWDADFRDRYKHHAYEFLSGSGDDHAYGTAENEENLVPDLADLSDEEFLQRLAAMRHEHQQTLEFCDKHGLHASSEPQHQEPSHPKASVDDNYSVTTHNYRSLAGDLMTTNVRDMVYPPFRARRAPIRKQVPVTSPCQKSSRKEREKRLSEELEIERQKMRECALDNYLASLSDDDYTLDEKRPGVANHHKSKRTLVRSSSLTKLADNSWKYRVTVPKPFKMTIRESQKLPVKSRSVSDFERQRRRQRLEEDLECSMKFKASPAPATIYVPLYDELIAEQRRQRLQNLTVRQRELLSMQRPFAFLRREENRQIRKQQREQAFSAADAMLPDANFRAKPFPQHLFSNEAYERMAEQEDMKEWEKQARAEKLLKTSSLPKNMTKKRPSHSCDLTSEDSCCSNRPQSGNSRHRSPRRTCSGVKNVQISRCSRMSPERESSSALCPGSTDQVRWPHTCIDANPISRSLTEMLPRSFVDDARNQSSTADKPRPRQALKSILKSSGQCSAIGVHVRPYDMEDEQTRVSEVTKVRSYSPKTLQPASSKATSVGRRWSSKTVDEDRIRREIEEDLKQID